MDIDAEIIPYLAMMVNEYPKGLALSNIDNKEVAVVLSPEYFQLLFAAAKLASNPHEFREAQIKDIRFQNGDDEGLVSFEKIYGVKQPSAVS